MAVPSAIKVFNWTATLYKGSITFEAPMLFALGFVCLFTVGGLTGLFLATLGMDMHVHDTYAELDQTAVVFHPLEEQYRTLKDQHEAGALGMWVFLGTEVMFFGALFYGVAAYRCEYPEAFEKASEHLNWIVGGINTVVLLVSSLFMVLAVHDAKYGRRKELMIHLALTALLGLAFLVFKAFEHYTDYRDNLISGWRFDDAEWIKEGVRPEQVKLFLMFYWIMTGLHGLLGGRHGGAHHLAADLRRRLRAADPADRPDGDGVLFTLIGDLAYRHRALHRPVQGVAGSAVFHARADQLRVTWIVIAVACFWLSILMVLGLTDYVSRDHIPLMYGH